MHSVLVTGGSGYVGSVLCSQLKACGCHVTALARQSRSGVWDEFLSVDLTQPLGQDLFSGFDTVFHLAGKAHAIAETPADAASYDPEIVGATQHVITACREGGVTRLVYVSSIKAMGESSNGCQVESDQTPPTTPYGLAKLRAEQLIGTFAQERSCAATIVRPTLVYGPQSPGNISKMIRAIAKRRFPPIQYSSNRRSMVHVQDLARALILAATKSAAVGETFIVSDGHGYSIGEIYQTIRDALGTGRPSASVPRWLLVMCGRLGDLIGMVIGRRVALDSQAVGQLFGSAWYSNEKAKAVLGFEPQHRLVDALPEILESMGIKAANP